MNEKIKKFFGESRKALSFDNALKWWMILGLYLVMILPFYLFYYFVNKDLFTLYGQIEFLKKVAWFPILFYLEFVILSYLKDRRKIDLEKEYPLKKTIKHYKEVAKKVAKNNINSLKIDWGQIILFVLGYLLTSFLLYRLVDGFHAGNIIKYGIPYTFLLVIKIIILFNIIELFTLTKSSRNKLFLLIGSIAFSDFFILLIIFFLVDSIEIENVKEIFGQFLSKVLSIDLIYLLGGIIFIII